MINEKDKDSIIKLSRWISRYPEEWEIICGLRTTGNSNTIRILKMLEAEEYHELAAAMASRLCSFTLDDDSCGDYTPQA